ncbi:MAG: hypothetical protein WC260_00285 [Candidatus Pacearchaeota archaeon]
MNYSVDDKAEDILKKYSAKIEKQMNQTNRDSFNSSKFSKSYEQFRKAMTPEFSRYEGWCKTVGNFIKVKASEKDRINIEKNINISHLNVTSSEVMGLAVFIMLSSLFGGFLILLSVYFITNKFNLLFLFLIFILSLFLLTFYSKAPERLAMKWRLKAGSQMVPAVLYVVIYMKHTSNLEKAVAFAAENLEDPLSTDFRKVFWDVEVGKFSTIKDSLDNYLENWRDYSLEFIEAFHLIESSLYESNEGRRVEILERSLQVILDGVYDKMLKYTHEVKSPLTNVYMLGIVLPTLALAILPLASTMVGDLFQTYHLVLMFNIIIPLLVIYLTYNVMMQRPGGHGNSDLLKKNPLYPNYADKKHIIKGFIYSIPFFLIGLFPLIWMYFPIHKFLGMPIDLTFGDLGFNFMKNTFLLGIMESGVKPGSYIGPFGPLSVIMGIFLPLGIANVFIYSSKKRTAELVKEKKKYNEVESEFTSSLFQLGNRIGDGSPAEIAFGKVSESSRGTATEGFFRIVNENINRFGMNLDRALFDSKRGAVIFYPSHLVITSMRILVESVKKGLKVAARSLMSISEYVKNIRKVDARLNDLLADIISDMKSNMTFLAPLLSGIIVGLSGMITLILGNLKNLMGSLGSGNELTSSFGNLSDIMSMFQLETMIPTYWIQVVVGIYLIQVVFILTSTLVTIKAGKDDLMQTVEIGTNLKKTILLYILVSIISTVALTLVGGIALIGLGV